MSGGQSRHLTEYQSSWKTDFEDERRRLHAIFGSAVLDIEHIGSTSVEGLASRPFIDLAVMIESQKDAGRFTEPLARIGYRFEPPTQAGTPERNFYKKGEPTKYLLSIAYTDIGGFWPRQILFRDHLRANPDARAEYTKIKEEMLGKDPSGRRVYHEGKTEFVYRILRSAGWKVFEMYRCQGAPDCPSVADVISGEDSTLFITFVNGEEGIFDMGRHLGRPAFHGITTSEDIKKASVYEGAVAWPGKVALDPHYLYTRCVRQE